MPSPQEETAIDLRSDTVTRPTDSMRDAARNATVGDNVYGEDPTVMRLESDAATLLGTEESLYLPSGTMANQVAALTHADHGDEVIVERRAHIFGWEVGGLAATCGLQVRPLDGGETGLFSADALASALISPSLHQAGTGLICIENTHNHAGGVAHSPDRVAAVTAVADEHGVPVHLDGARLFNAAIAHNVSPDELVEPVDTVMVSLSKGLGAPVGSLLAGPAETIEAAIRYRKRLGGGMRQAGVIAAPAIEALHSWERLDEDHARARRLAAGIDEIEGLSVQTPETNIVLVDIEGVTDDAEVFLEACETAGVRGVQFGPTRVRFCTHRDINDDDIEAAIDAVGTAVSS